MNVNKDAIEVFRAIDKILGSSSDNSDNSEYIQPHFYKK